MKLRNKLNIIFSILLIFIFTTLPTYASNIFEVEQEMKNANNKMAAAHQMADGARALGYPEDNEIIVLAGKEWVKYYTIYNNSKSEYDVLYHDFYEVKAKEYPEATAVWLGLQKAGFSDASIAGILGNMMTECGGQSLALQPTIWNATKRYYGLCQWSKKYHPNVAGASLENQIQYLIDTIPSELCYLSDPEDAAHKFARDYERCSSGSYRKRKINAKTAFTYFTTHCAAEDS